MRLTDKELDSEIESMVAHIARRAGLFQDEVWEKIKEAYDKRQTRGDRDSQGKS